MLEISSQNSIPNAFAGMELASKKQGPNLEEALAGQILTKVRGFPSIPGIQKYDIKGKQSGAPVKGQVRKLLW